jgi:hypothetical protein
MSTTWQNRIVDHGEESPEQLAANPKNWRIHPRHQQDALEAVLGRIGWVQDVIVNRTTGYVLDGHLRVALALSKGEPTIPVSYVELSDAEEDMILASLDPSTGLAGADDEALGRLLEADTDGELERMFAGNSTEPQDRGEWQPEPPSTNGSDHEPPEGHPDIEPDPDDGFIDYVVMCPECGTEFSASVPA